ncbi:MAG: efflux transporter periplasmic adaptor subunit [Chloroflexi bacterium 13_1_20CM_2_59_7]|nr:MAG: efflux transporter periplasmic adaptor subunit [Chloroflexi bacterium 13_1_20CM_2_59_7]
MRNYRKAFFLALVGNLVFLGALAGIWWSARRSTTPRHAAGSAPNVAAQLAQSSSPSSAPPPMETPLAPVQLSAERLQSIGVMFGTVERKPVQDEIRVTGNVAIDETRLSYVQTRFSGYIVKVFADATYKYVRDGQPLFTIYSPELAAAEREYLLAKQNAQGLSQSTVPGVSAGFASLLAASADRLKQWNVPQREIDRLESSSQVQQELEIDSPVSGYITERHALPNLTFQPDTHLYTIANLSTVWVFAQIFQNDLGRIRVGAPTALSVDSYPGKTFRGRVDFIYPDVDTTTRTARVRLVFSNPNLALTPGMYVNVVLQVPLGNQLVIPVGGVLQSGTRQIVFVDRGAGYLEPRDVQLGPQAGDQYVVLKGLKAGERIVTSANFLIDSESQLQAAVGSFVPPPPGAGEAAAMNAPTTRPAPQIELSTAPSTPRKGTNLYRVKLATSDGFPITGAQVSVRSYMPGMPQMGMAAMNVVTPLSEKGGGIYEGQVNLDSGGAWQLTITAIKNGAVLATKKLSVNAEGGM